MLLIPSLNLCIFFLLQILRYLPSAKVVKNYLLYGKLFVERLSNLFFFVRLLKTCFMAVLSAELSLSSDKFKLLLKLVVCFMLGYERRAL